MTDYFNKYLKYKNKYLRLKNKFGGDSFNNIEGCNRENVSSNKNIDIVINEINEKYKIEELNDLYCLKCLNLFFSNITGEIKINLFKRFIYLEELNLSQNQLEGELDLLFFNSRLKKLNLSNNKFTGELKNIDHLINIEYLNISNNNFNFDFNKLL